ncbi:MAG: metalloregulator ArsR/SmtB family transcription factor [Chitinophagales bacterium]|nr:metalloregulator ArsR/SmtB family transcription factor [Chitinophagales bacterium]
MNYLNKEEMETLQRAKSKVRALYHPLRQSILVLINDSNNRMNVTDIYVKLRIEQSVASQHLAILRNEGFVNTEREGKTIWYSVNTDAVKSFVQNVNEVLESAASIAA